LPVASTTIPLGEENEAIVPSVLPYEPVPAMVETIPDVLILRILLLYSVKNKLPDASIVIPLG
jgi:hypothetical protein